MAASEGMWLHLPPDKALQPRPVRLTGAAAAMEWAIAEVHGGKKRASKDRVDLAALAAHCGTSYVQTETVPKALFESVRETQANVVALVLLPPGAGASSVAGGDAVVLFYDATGPLKGLPPNGRADMLAAASGLAGRKFYGEAVLARLVHGTESLSLGENLPGADHPARTLAYLPPTACLPPTRTCLPPLACLPPLGRLHPLTRGARASQVARRQASSWWSAIGSKPRRCSARALHLHCTRAAPALHPRNTRAAPALHPRCTRSAPALHPL